MDNKVLFRGQRADNGEWVEGYYVNVTQAYNKLSSFNKAIGIYIVTIFNEMIEVIPETVGKYTDFTDKKGVRLFDGDIIKNYCGIIMLIKYGTYEAYCPADNLYMRGVGFYVEAIGYPQMPLGNTEIYAEKIGNIYDSPELLGGAGQ